MNIDFQAREVTLKLVYYGPGLSGKTTNLQALHERVQGGARGHMMTLETRDDRTLFFDLLPLSFSTGEGGFSIRIKVFTVPGQVIHKATRKLVLQGADGVAFIADSQVEETKNNATAFLDLRDNLKANGLSLSTLPLVLQFNKRDMPSARSDADITAQARRGREPVFCAVATRCEGVVETFIGLLFLTWLSLKEQHQLKERVQIDGARLFPEILRRFGELRPLKALLDTSLSAQGYELSRRIDHV